MTKISYLILGIFLALLEISINLKFYNIGITIIAVTMISLALYLNKKNNLATITLISGSLVLDILSPYRFGLYLLFSLLSLALFGKIIVKSSGTEQPLYTVLLFFFFYLTSHFFELFTEPVYSILLVSLMINSVLGMIITLLINRYAGSIKSRITISKDVNI